MASLGVLHTATRMISFPYSESWQLHMATISDHLLLYQCKHVNVCIYIDNIKMCINTYTHHHICMYASYMESSLWAGTTLYKALCTQKMSSKNLKKHWRAQHRGRWDLTQAHPTGGGTVTIEDTLQWNGPGCWKDIWPQSLTHPFLLAPNPIIAPSPAPSPFCTQRGRPEF